MLKSCLFKGTSYLITAQSSVAIFYSLFACCKLNQVDPVEWLTDVMLRLPEHPVNRIEELLPHLWKKAEQGKM